MRSRLKVGLSLVVSALLVMPAASAGHGHHKTARVLWPQPALEAKQLGGSPSTLYLPIAQRKAGIWCPEPANDRRDGACGQLQPGVVYREFISSASDQFDWFYFNLPIAGAVEAWLTEIPSSTSRMPRA